MNSDCQIGKLGDAIENDLKAIKILEKAYPDKRNLDLADAYSDIAYAYLGLEDVDETQKYLNYAFEILDNMVKETSEHYYLPCSTLASLLEALQDYENAEHMYLHTARLMTANGYHEDEPTVVMFRNKAAEMHSKRK